jgi:TfoX/Sxy family transcriptional regulator of competence genes
MAYDEKVADRLRAALTRTLGPTDDIEERKMFGGIAELVNGHMCVGVLGSDLVVRVRVADADSVLRRPHVRPMDFTGRPMKGWIYVSPAGFAADAELDDWVRAGLAFVREAGPKVAGAGKPMKSRPASRPGSRLPRPGGAPARANRGGRGSRAG